MTYSISIVIPNYNGRQLLEKNLPFVYSSLKTSEIEDFEIIIPDDASKDTSVQFLKDHYPEVTIIEHPENLGFAGNINSGAKTATKDLVFLLNSDVQLTDGYFIPLLKYFDRPTTFGVGGLIKGFDGENQDQAKYPAYSYGNIVGTKNYAANKKTGNYTFFLSGANALVDREKFAALGGFCEMFSPYYGEDLDLGIKAWRSGYQCFFDKSSICFHEASSTIKKEPTEKVKVITKRNKIYLHYLHLEGGELIFFMTKIVLKVFFRLLMFNTIYLRSYLLFLEGRKSLKEEKQKRKITSKNTLSIREIVKVISDKISLE